MKKVIALLIFIIIFGVLIIYRWNQMLAGGGEPDADIIPVETVMVSTVEFEEKISFAAGIEPEEKAAVVCKVPGRTVLRVLVSEGDQVKKDAPLAVVDDSLVRQQVIQAEAVLGRASSYSSVVQSDYKRIAGLYREDVVSRQQYERMEGEAKAASRQVQEAKAALAQLKIMLGYHTIRAPISGTVLARNIDPGDTVSQAPAFLLSRQEKVKVSGGIPERVFPSVRVGQEALVTVDAFPSKTFRAEVSRVYPSLDPVTRTGQVEVLLPSNGELLPGMYSRVTISTGRRKGNALPLEAVGSLAGTGESVCYVISGDRAFLRKIQGGARQGNYMEILSGIGPGEPVISARSEKIFDGVRVRVTNK
ncbi:MAG: efflux RND transporter periplasmic adaptor subunit [Synergistaceae bacterium]|nr:efflux RND transporter periplasmic adaptor subunit [Synergistaceae bacterium]